MFVSQEKNQNVDILVLDDHGDTIEEDIENEDNEKKSPVMSKRDIPKKGHDSTTTNSNKLNKEATFGESAEEIPFTASLKKSEKSDTGHFNPDTSNDHTFGRRSKLSSKHPDVDEDS